MRFYTIIWMCPDCGRLHRLTLRAVNEKEARNKFEGYWVEMGQIVGPLKLPLLTILEGELTRD